MLVVLNVVKLIAEIALMALLGQWLVGLMAGAGRKKNLFYQILEIVGRPFVVAARFIAPAFVLERHIPLVAFLVLLVLWLGVTIAKIQHCVQIGVQQCL